MQEGPNETLSLDVNADGSKFATGGRDKIVLYYLLNSNNLSG